MQNKRLDWVAKLYMPFFLFVYFLEQSFKRNWVALRLPMELKKALVANMTIEHIDEQIQKNDNLELEVNYYRPLRRSFYTLYLDPYS